MKFDIWNNKHVLALTVGITSGIMIIIYIGGCLSGVYC